MKISVIESPRNIVIRNAELPEINDDEILVKLDGTGVCASNLPVWEGREWFRYPFEAGAPGHEGYGFVEKAGRNTEGFFAGDRVAFLSYHAYAEYDKAPGSDVVKLPASLHGKPFPGEPAACAVNIFDRSDIRQDQIVVLIGAGFLGCLLVQLLKHEGARVIVVSRRQTSLRYALDAGADQIVQWDDFGKVIKRIIAISGGEVPRVIEATGMQQAIDLATEIISIRGKLVIAGYHQDGFRNINLQQWNWKGIDVINAHERDPRIYIKGLKKAISLAEENILQPGKFISHYFGFEEINSAFRMLSDRPEEFLKAVIKY